jgi:hypothetical protein
VSENGIEETTVNPQDNPGRTWWQEWLNERFSKGAMVSIGDQQQALTLPPQAFEFTPDDPTDSDFSESAPNGTLRIVAVNVDSGFPMGFTVDTSSEGPEQEVSEDRTRVYVRTTDGKRVVFSAHISEVHEQMVAQMQKERGF